MVEIGYGSALKPQADDSSSYQQLMEEVERDLPFKTWKIVGIYARNPREIYILLSVAVRVCLKSINERELEVS